MTEEDYDAWTTKLSNMAREVDITSVSPELPKECADALKRAAISLMNAKACIYWAGIVLQQTDHKAEARAAEHGKQD